MATLANYPVARPAYMLDFVSGSHLDPRIAFARASAATRRNAAGVLETVPAGVPRIDHDPITGRCLGLNVDGASKTNMVPRNLTTGAIVGLVGAGGALPTTWASTPKATSGLDTEVLAVGVESGLPYVDLKFTGTPIAGYQGIVFGNFSGFTSNTEYSGSVFAKMLSGAAGGAGSLQLQARYNTSGGSVNISGGYTPSALNGDLRAQRLISSGTTNASVAGAGSFLLVFNLTNGVAYEFTVRVALPQLELGATTSPIFTDGTPVTRAAEIVTLDLPEYGDITILTEYGYSYKVKNSRALGLYAASATSSNIAVLAANQAGTAVAGVIASPNGPQVSLPPVTPTVGRVERVAFSRAADGRMYIASRGTALASGVHTGVTAPMRTICLGNTTPAGVSQLDGYIRRVSIWFQALTQAELNKLSEV